MVPGSSVRSTIALAAGVVLAAASTDVRAACSGPGPTETFESYSYVVSPGINTPQSIESAFWALGFGDPAPGSGADNGGWGDTDSTPDFPSGWLHAYSLGSYLLGAWSSSGGVDDCIRGRIAPGKSGEIMVAAFSDEPISSERQGFFAVAAVQRGAGGASDYEFTFPGQDITLVPIPRPSIVSSHQTSQGQLELTVRGPALQTVASGVYTDGSVSAGELILGYRVYLQAVPPGTPAPASRRRDSGWVRVADSTPLGQTTTFTISVPCDDTYLTLSLVFDSSFETEHVSENSPRIATRVCDPVYDFDGDGFTPTPCCANGGDCDDGNPYVHPGAPEICNGIDDNCDGRIDENVDGTDSDSDGIPNACDNCVFEANHEQHDLDHDGQGDACDLDDGLILVRFHQPAQVEWQREAGFLSWNLYKGDLQVLEDTGVYTQAPGSNPLARRDCDLTSPQTLDPQAPGPGGVAFFLVTGETVSREGSLGTDSHGTERRNTNPCP